MKIKLLYFGRPREALNTSEEIADVPTGIATLAELLVWLRARGEKWAKELADNRVRENDEIALFSPISGG